MPDPTTFDFEDGRGPVPAHRHTNGGGWVSDDCVVDAPTYIEEDACVWGGCILDSVNIYNEARVSGNSSLKERCVVSGGAVIVSSYLSQGTHVSNSAEVRNSVLRGGVVTDRAKVLSSRVYGPYVSGDAVVRDATVEGTYSIAGQMVVERPPLLIYGFRYPVVATPGHIGLGCQFHPVEWWFGAPAIGAPDPEALRLMSHYTPEPEEFLRHLQQVHTFWLTRGLTPRGL